MCIAHTFSMLFVNTYLMCAFDPFRRSSGGREGLAWFLLLAGLIQLCDDLIRGALDRRGDAGVSGCTSRFDFVSLGVIPGSVVAKIQG